MVETILKISVSFSSYYAYPHGEDVNVINFPSASFISTVCGWISEYTFNRGAVYTALYLPIISMLIPVRVPVW